MAICLVLETVADLPVGTDIQEINERRGDHVQNREIEKIIVNDEQGPVRNQGRQIVIHAVTAKEIETEKRGQSDMPAVSEL